MVLGYRLEAHAFLNTKKSTDEINLISACPIFHAAFILQADK
jgi:hypothetical protein